MQQKEVKCAYLVPELCMGASIKVLQVEAELFMGEIVEPPMIYQWGKALIVEGYYPVDWVLTQKYTQYIQK